MAKGRTDGEDTESECDPRDEPSWTDPFTSHVGRNLEDDVRDVEDGQDFVVVVSLQMQVFLESGELCIT